MAVLTPKSGIVGEATVGPSLAASLEPLAHRQNLVLVLL